MPVELKTTESRQSRLRSFEVRRLAAAFPQASLLAGLSAPTSASKLAETKRRQAGALQSCAKSSASIVLPCDFDATLLKTMRQWPTRRSVVRYISKSKT